MMQAVVWVFCTLVVSFSLFSIVDCLDCYQCTGSEDDTCTGSTSCSAGQVCLNKVFKRYTLPTLYDKGCMTKSSCYSLGDLNTDRYCSVTPSTCTYCCGSNLCNGGRSGHVFNLRHLPAWTCIILLCHLLVLL